MNKQNLIRDMQQYVGAGFITACEFASYIGMKDSGKAKRKYLKDLESVDGKRYFIRDVAQMLIERSK